ncbi:maleylpyruvate isomerase family mycothiol-dependent enzyme [Kitasatospora sp. MAP5-34]|uniref:maleylpyruvate isomerase family mycothiol-dependent enzyme n=1 Tax=Kitasatospora sp. MAP5-34 TaxID=3035102 RepID=UPI002476DB2D|nr:maleylpyruvate isomerase family mycothiol-dependent enzyme [Kitasatospora sp. MAP5-34]MDH6575390.1 uncharacterized protein (TIGR03083 family) [Kitasatospora sp. MAP5-34]
MDRTDYMYALRRDGARMAEATAGHLALPVPSCPEWTVADLVGHTGSVHRFWAAIASGELTDPSGYTPPARPAEDGLLGWFAEGVELAAATLETLDPELPRWTWADRKDVGFIQRRMAQETAVHAWDALAAVGREQPIEPVLAMDGVDEFLAHFATGAPPAGLPEAGIHLHAIDGPGEWSIRTVDGAWQVGREHGKGAAAVRGTTSDLLLLLWQRRSPGQLETFGDLAVLETFLSAYFRD